MSRWAFGRHIMSLTSPVAKRKAQSRSISPPPLKRALQSSTTKNAVAKFFTPTSQKSKDRTTWTERRPREGAAPSLLVGRYTPEGWQQVVPGRRKIAAFDLDSTLISPASGKKHAVDATDWGWWDRSVPDRLRQLHKEGYQVVILSNQAGLTLHFDPGFKGLKASAQKRVSEFKLKCSAVLGNLDLPTSIFAATERDLYRKPRTGMWQQACEDYSIPEAEVDLERSIFVGDAGGRIASLNGNGQAISKDFSCSDRNFAHNLGIRYETPEQFFLEQSPRDFQRDIDLARYPFTDTHEPQLLFEKQNKQDIVLFCGSPGAGKSTFFWRHLKPLEYERINQDTLKTREKCIQAAKARLDEGTSIVIDNTNADPETRAVWVDLARKYEVPVRCIWFKTSVGLCEHNDAFRAQHPSLNPEARQGLTRVAFQGFISRFKEPRLREGFQDILEHDFRFQGTAEEYKIWGQYWV